MKRVLKLFSLLILVVILFIPSTASAATQSHSYINTNTYLGISDTDLNRNYYFGPSTLYPASSGSRGLYRTFFHQVTDGNNIYLAYCMDPNWGTYNASGSILSSSSTTLVDSGHQAVTGDRLQLLKNILAAGQQLGSSSTVEVFKTNASNATLKNYLATQILVWEVMSRGRLTYEAETLATPADHSTTFSSLDFVKKDTELFNKYKNILSRAKQLTEEGKPAALKETKPYILQWVDSKNMYVSKTIDVGSYTIPAAMAPLSVNITLSGGKLTITSTEPLDGPQELNLSITRGTTSASANFRWFMFENQDPNLPSSKQRMLLAYYQGSNSAKIKYNTEKGTFKINKYDLDTKKGLPGAEFTMYKCKSTISCDKTGTKIKISSTSNSSISEEIVINKSGLYKFVETKVPKGYDKIKDFYLTLEIQSDGNVKIKPDAKDADFIKVAEANSERWAHLLLYNKAKTFTITKYDGNTNKKVAGATFQIKKSTGDVVKFNKISDGNYQYSTSGTVTDLVSNDLSSYTISALPAGTYKLVEIAPPTGYVLSENVNDRTKTFIVGEGTTEGKLTLFEDTGRKVVNMEVGIKVYNYKTKVTINKTGSGGKVVPGVVFELYDSNKENKISVVSVDGKYYYNGVITSETHVHSTPTELSTNENGKIIINNLPEGTYYLKEIFAPEESGFVIPENPWTKLTVKLGKTSDKIVKTISNAKGEFCFYKIDEDGNYLDKGKFKLQVYNDTTSSFEDVALKFVEDENGKWYIIDKNSNLYMFSPLSDGKTCFRELEAKKKYKIVEIEAPDGYIYPNNQADREVEVYIDEHQFATGDAVIINKKVLEEGDQAQAELIVGISTGMDKINYVLIIGGIGLLIGGLIFIKKKMDK